jgi:hypothetical protein
VPPAPADDEEPPAEPVEVGALRGPVGVPDEPDDNATSGAVVTSIHALSHDPAHSHDHPSQDPDDPDDDPTSPVDPHLTDPDGDRHA